MNLDFEVALFVTVGVLLAAVLIVTVRPWANSRTGERRAAPVNARRADTAAARRERRRAEEIVERMAEGALVLDESLRPVFANRAARSILGLQPATLPHRLPSDEVLAVARRARREGEWRAEAITIWFPRRRMLRVRAAALHDGDAIAVFLQDVTEELRTQQIRTEFVAHASHELKSPVAGLQAVAEAIAEALAADDRDAAARFAARLGGEADRLGRLVRDLLDLSRLEDPASPPHEPVDLSAVAEKEVASIRESADDKDVSLVGEISSGLWVRGDDRHLGLMLRNLLDNAVRYTSSGGRVTVTLTQQDGEAVLSVADDGIGIPRDAQERIFERFYRVDRARSRERGGTGLGLAIVKHAVELHGGRIVLDSELGRGTTFTISLPAIEPQQRPVRSVAG